MLTVVDVKLQNKCCSILSMGYLAEFPVMDAKRVLCPSSSGKLTNHHIIKDHMISHYKKIYSAKAAVDCTVPRSMSCNVKYIDQKCRQQLKRDISEWTQSVKSHMHKSIKKNATRTCSRTVRGDEGTRLCMVDCDIFSPRFNTSFHCKQTVYHSQMAASSANCGRASELIYSSPNSQCHQFCQSSVTSTSQKKFKSFQDPMQKTYSGDILLKHTHYFTQEKPFTPRTLKSNSKSSLSTYRYYTCPNRREVEEKTLLNQQEAYYGSTNNNQGCSAGLDSPPGDLLPYSLDHGWSDGESDVFRRYSTANKTKDSDFLLSSSRVSPEGMKSPIIRKVTAEEDELLYLEFITDVTDDIVARGIYSDRVLERVFKRHIDMNRHRLNEDKMRHLLDDLQNDLQSPPDAFVTALEYKETARTMLHRHKSSSLGQELTSVATDDINLLPCTSFEKDKEEPESAIPLLYSMPASVCVPKSAGAIKQEDENNIMDLEHQQKEVNVKSLSLEHYQLNEEDKHQNYTDQNELIKQLDELGRNISESLSVSGTHSLEVVIEQESTVKLCENEF
ncbi:spermatogenesis-associated protein 7 isoform X2 [Electrophorus electricus]|uniref:spermatogenesis-associated protein 7 isoform X2 n=1 Tax=Electrophorus electricus TaxID=8005 RepID=UPI0015CFCD70|nr:spermatogenesis-associated protein 7 isoform X2 [Electrophorus electricus]